MAVSSPLQATVVGGRRSRDAELTSTPSVKLTAAELIFRRGTPPEATYSFKHALVQDAAYQSLLKSRRQQIHAHIAEVLEERLPADRCRNLRPSLP